MRNDDGENKQMFDTSVILCMKHDIDIPEVVPVKFQIV